MITRQLAHKDLGVNYCDEFNLDVSMLLGQPSLALFKAGSPGTYTFYCNVPGHPAAGMVGTLILIRVTPAN